MSKEFKLWSDDKDEDKIIDELLESSSFSGRIETVIFNLFEDIRVLNEELQREPNND